ncbi:unnamed protein product [Cylindrotheca closterium]|uniref:Uncharacterized protein n=1 Tax=Cylindrotheca closterium TaxID=2856 RepID=A0AAD2FJW7_9STRA|nr:unnamed protein product [Cylindrotheca closterium]
MNRNRDNMFSIGSDEMKPKNVVVFRQNTPSLWKRKSTPEQRLLHSLITSGEAHIHIDPSVQHLERHIFADMQGLVEVIDKSNGRLKSLGAMTFKGCLNLRNVHLKSPLIKFIPNGAFLQCRRLTTIELPSSILRLEQSAFSCCTALKHIQIPPKVVQVQKRAFYRCKRLETIGWPEMLFEISADTLFGCQALVNVQLPSSVQTIRERAFAGCSSLVFLGLPEGLYSIETSAFEGCRSMVILKLPTSLAEIQTHAFEDCSELMSIEVCGNTMCRLEVHFYGFEGCASLIHLSTPQNLHLNIDCFGERPNFSCGKLMDDPTPRFESLPMHEWCYHQVYFPLSSILHEISNLSGQEVSPMMMQHDRLGMTPFHILALSSRPDKALFECFIDKLSLNKEVLLKQDNLDFTPLDYLFRNPSNESRESLSYLAKLLVNDRIEGLTLKRWRDELSGMLTVFLHLDKAEQTRARFRTFLRHISTKEHQEVLSILECAVWKVKLIDVTMNLKNTANEYVDRHFCRVSCGVEGVISNVLPFLERPDKLTH